MLFADLGLYEDFYLCAAVNKALNLAELKHGLVNSNGAGSG
jgi:hypothetical protein